MTNHRNRLHHAAAVAAITVLVIAGRVQAEPVPKTITIKDARLPIWVDADVAVTPDGQPNAAVLGPYSERLSEIIAAASSGECYEVPEIFIDHASAPDRHSLDLAIETAPIAMHAVVTAKRFGFHGFVPGQLLQVRPLRGFGARRPDRAFYYAFMPVGTFNVAGAQICKTDARYATVPEVGEELLLLVNEPADPARQLLTVYGPEDVVTFSQDAVRLPRAFSRGDDSRGPVTSKCELLTSIAGRRKDVAR